MKAIGFFGAGKMAEGILSAILDRSSVIMAEKSAERAADIAKRTGVEVVGEACEVAKNARLIFLAVRPQDVSELAAQVRPWLKKGQTIVSIVAGKRIAYLRKAFGAKVGIIRVMPNLALRAGAGMCAVAAARSTPKAVVDQVLRILGGAGVAIRLDERHFDAVTALSGSGPAYFAYMEEAMAAAGEQLGLEKDVARLLAEQTMYGTAKFLRESKMALRPFIEGVSTRGGTTAAGMVKLEARGVFRKLVAATLKAAAERSAELGK